MEKGKIQRWKREGCDGEEKRQRQRDSLEEKQSGALIAKSELKERGRHAVIITDPI